MRSAIRLCGGMGPAVLTLCLCAAAATALAATPPTPYRAGELVVRFAQPFPVAAATAATDAALAPRPARELAASGRGPASLQALEARHGLTQARPLYTPGLLPPRRAARRAPAAPATGASDLWVLEFAPGADLDAALLALRSDPAVRYAERNAVGSLAYAPSDPRYAEQAADLALVGMEAAWDVRPGATADTVVAIVDSGVDPSHRDLADALDWRASYNFADGNHHIFDDQGHGTRVAGIAGAIANNGEGMAGVAFGCTLLSLDVANASGAVSSADVAEAVYYAIDQGATVVNMSLRFTVPSQPLEDACAAAAEAGIVLVAAAGNENQGDSAVYPASYGTVIGVGATMDDGVTRASFSNYNGREDSIVQLVAPGATVFSTVPGSQYNGTFGSGTSFAAPIVSGVAALLCAAHPGQSAASVAAHLQATATPLGAWAGAGRVDAAAGLSTPMTPSVRIAATSVDDALLYSTVNNGSGLLNPGESARILVVLTSDRSDATTVTAVLSTASPAVVSLGNASAAYAQVPSGGLAGNDADPFGPVRIASGTTETSAAFTLDLTAAGGYAATLHFTLPIQHQTVTSGTLTDATFLGGTVYHVNGDLVCAGTTTVQPGARFEVDPGCGISVPAGAAFSAVGTEAQPIVITSSRPFGYTGSTPSDPLPGNFAGPRNEAVDLASYGRVLYVDPLRGRATGPGTPPQPYATLGQALAASAGATTTSRCAILMAEGRCEGNVVMRPHVDLYGGFEARGWTRDIFAHTSTLDALSSGSVVIAAHQSRIDGFLITAGYMLNNAGGVVCGFVKGARVTNNFIVDNASGAVGVAVQCSGSSATIANNLLWTGTGSAMAGFLNTVGAGAPYFARNIVGNGPQGGVTCMSSTNAILEDNVIVQCKGAPAVRIWSSPVTVRGNKILGNRDQSTGGDAGIGVYIAGASSPAVYANVIQDNAAISMAAAVGTGITVLGGASPNLYNNLVRGNDLAGSGNGGIYVDATSAARIRNCIVRGNQGAAQVTGSAISDLSYCNLAQSWTGLGSGNLNASEATVGSVAWGIFTNQVYYPQTRRTRLTVAQSGLRVHSLAGQPIKIEGLTYVVQDNLADTVTIYGSLPSSLLVRTNPVAGSQRVALARRPLRLRWSVEDFHLAASSSCIDKGVGSATDVLAPPWDMDHEKTAGPTNDIGPDRYKPRAVYGPWGVLSVSPLAASATFAHCLIEGGGGVQSGQDTQIDDSTVRHMANDGIRFLGGSTQMRNVTADSNLGTGILANGRTLTGCSASYNTTDGIQGDLLTSCTATANLRRGLAATRADFCTADYNTSAGCVLQTGADGTRARGNGGDGIVFTITGVTSGCLAYGNAGAGVRFEGIGAEINAVTAVLNGGTGISAPRVMGTFADCTANYNGGFGIEGSGPPTVLTCRAIGNADAGLTSGGYVSGCYLANNQAGILYAQTLENSYLGGNQLAGADADPASGPFLDRCSIVGNQGDGARNFLGIQNCWIVGNSGTGLTNTWTLGSGRGDATSCTIRNNANAGTWNLNSLHRSNISGNTVGRIVGVGVDPFESVSAIAGTAPDHDFTGNYWGPAHTAELDAGGSIPPYNAPFLRDRYDGSGMCAIQPIPYATAPIANAPDMSVIPPFLFSVAPSETDSLNVGLTTFTLVYTQAMRTATNPSVTFAAGDPYTAHVVRPAPGWVDATTWRGVYTVASDTGDGVQTILVADAYSQSGLWLPDDLTHRFTINTGTTGTLAANNGLASASGTTMDVSWSADGLPAGTEGFNVLRSDSNTPGTFSAVNDSLISASGLTSVRGKDGRRSSNGAYSDSLGLAPSTTYWYIVEVVDAGNNAMQWTPPFFGTTNSWSVDAPAVVNREASRQTTTRATLGGTVDSTGGEDPAVRIYWGRTDGGTEPADWDYVEDLGQRPIGDFSIQLTSLAQGTEYYYRCYGVNSQGESWAPESIYFEATSTLPAPTAVAATDGVYTDHVTVTWTPPADMTYCRLYRSDSPTGTRTALTGWVAATTFDDYTLTSGTLYYYWVKASSNSGGSPASAVSVSDTGYSGELTTPLDAPASVAASDGAYADRVDVTWATVAGATHYLVSRSDTAGGAKTALSAWQTAAAFSDATGAAGTVYYYWVQAASNASGGRASAYGGPDAGSRANGPLPLAAPTGLAASDGTFTDRVQVAWNPVSGATHYLVSRADALAGAKTVLGVWQSATTYDDTAATTQTTYYYWVQAAADASGARASAYSTPDTGWRNAENALPVPTGLAASDGAYAGLVQVAWNTVSGATHYRLYRAESVDGTKTALADWATTTSYADTSVTTDTVYYYWVRAAADASGGQASFYSTLDTGWAGTTQIFKISYKGCDLTVHNINSLQILNSQSKASVSITKLKKPPQDLTPVPGTAYANCAALASVTVAGSLGKFSTQAGVASLTVTGAVGSVSANGCSVDALTAAAFKSIKLTAAPDSTRADHPKRLWTTIMANGGEVPDAMLSAAVSLTGVGLAQLSLPGQSVSLKVASKAGKSKAGGPFVSLADVAAGAGIRAGDSASVSLTGGNLLGPVAASGTVRSVAVKALRSTLTGDPAGLVGGYVGSPDAFPASPAALPADPAAYDVQLCAGEAAWLAAHPSKGAKPPVLIGTVSAPRGAMAWVMAGYRADGAGNAVLTSATCAGTLGSVKTPAPSGNTLGLWGRAWVRENTTPKLSGDTGAVAEGRFVVVTEP